MATTLDYVEFFASQISNEWDIRYKKMFGEFMLYINNKPIFLICDNTVFVKMLEEVKDLLNNSGTGHPYDSAKEHYILDIEDKELIQKVIEVLEPITPLPKPRKKKVK